MNDEEIKAKLRTLTRAQRDAYAELMSGNWDRAHYGLWQQPRKWETLKALVDAGLAEWRSQFPDVDESYQHYIVPVGTPTHSELKAKREAVKEAVLRQRAEEIVERASGIIYDPRMIEMFTAFAVEMLRESS